MNRSLLNPKSLIRYLVSLALIAIISILIFFGLTRIGSEEAADLHTVSPSVLRYDVNLANLSRMTHRGLEASISRLAWTNGMLEVDLCLRNVGGGSWYLRSIEHFDCLFWDCEGNYLESQGLFFLPLDDAFLRSFRAFRDDPEARIVSVIVQTDLLYVPRGADTFALAFGKSGLVTKPVKLPAPPEKNAIP